ncbi:hypothetical protein RJ641_031565 [Dillenia turbinata]|uniref:Uncharacterized protein n=1 Tax=Dillenia turbinata TaxID=194707 RepID=A0AAN8ZHK6_9MAGN
MDEAEKRRERLKAMRREAVACSNKMEMEMEMETPTALSNPLLLETLEDPGGSVPRFDFYTDPMSAFSTNKRTKNAAPSPFTPPRTASPRPRFPSSPFSAICPRLSPDTRQYQAHGIHQSYQSLSSIGTASPFPVHPRMPSGDWNNAGGTPSYHVPPPSGGWSTPTGFVREGAPTFSSGRGRGKFYHSPIPMSGQGGSLRPFSGRGRLSNHSSSPGSGQSGGWVLREKEIKSMLEDPWKDLKPVVWRRLDPPDSMGHWLPKSIRKTVDKAPNPPKKFSSHSSLAEYLAASFNEAVDSTNKFPST